MLPRTASPSRSPSACLAGTVGVLAVLLLTACSPAEEAPEATRQPQRVIGELRVLNLTGQRIEVTYGTATVATPLENGDATQFQKNKTGDRPVRVNAPGQTALETMAPVEERRQTTVVVYPDANGLQAVPLLADESLEDTPSLRLLRLPGAENVAVSAAGKFLTERPITSYIESLKLEATADGAPSLSYPVTLDKEGAYTVVVGLKNNKIAITVVQDNPKLVGVGDSGASGN